MLFVGLLILAYACDLSFPWWLYVLALLFSPITHDFRSKKS